MKDFLKFPDNFHRHYGFLKQVFVLAISAFGGPQAHIAMMLDILVKRRKYLTEAELIELNALCQFLPGPTSTQTLTSIGYKRGGPWLAFATLILWVIPATILMTIIAFGYVYFENEGIDTSFLKILQPVVVGIIAVAAFRLAKAVIKRPIGWIIMVLATVATFFLRTPFAFPIILFLGGLSSKIFNTEKMESHPVKIKPVWRNFYIFIGVFVLAIAMGFITQKKPVWLFENTYRFGSLVFGGGQVLIPMMYEQFVNFTPITQPEPYLTQHEFMTGYGMAQAIPGPVFSFASYIDAMAMKEYGAGGMILGVFIGSIGIFLPGTLLIFFIYPIWNQLKQKVIVKKSLAGINAAATGMVAAASFIFMEEIGYEIENFIIVLVSIVLLQVFKLQTFIVVFLALIIGILI